MAFRSHHDCEDRCHVACGLMLVNQQLKKPMLVWSLTLAASNLKHPISRLDPKSARKVEPVLCLRRLGFARPKVKRREYGWVGKI